MSVQCEKCGADISYESEVHPNCNTVQKLRAELAKLKPVNRIRLENKRLRGRLTAIAALAYNGWLLNLNNVQVLNKIRAACSQYRPVHNHVFGLAKVKAVLEGLKKEEHNG